MNKRILNYLCVCAVLVGCIVSPVAAKRHGRQKRLERRERREAAALVARQAQEAVVPQVEAPAAAPAPLVIDGAMVEVMQNPKWAVAKFWGKKIAAFYAMQFACYLTVTETFDDAGHLANAVFVLPEMIPRFAPMLRIFASLTNKKLGDVVRLLTHRRVVVTGLGLHALRALAREIDVTDPKEALMGALFTVIAGYKIATEV